MSLKRKSFRYLIAPSNASVRDKLVADTILSGTADQTIINAALATYGNVEIAAGNVSLTAAISIIGIPGGSGTDSPTFQLRGQGKHSTIISSASNINTIELTSDPSVIIENIHIKPLGSGHGIKSTAWTTSYRGFWMSMFKNIYIEGDFSTHTGYAMYLEGPFRSTFENIEGLGIANGMYLAATNSTFNPGNCSFTRCFFDLYRANGKGYYLYTPDTGGQFNITKFQQCEAIDSTSGGGASTTSVGMHFRGSATQYYATKNIMIDSTNIEGFNTAIKFEHAISNRCSFNYVDVKAGGTYVQFSSDSNNNVVEILSSYVPVSTTVTLINDANTSTTQPNIVKGTECYCDTGSTVNATLTSATILEQMGLSGPGTIATVLSTRSRNSNQTTLVSADGTRYKVTVSNAGVLTTTSV